MPKRKTWLALLTIAVLPLAACGATSNDRQSSEPTTNGSSSAAAAAEGSAEDLIAKGKMDKEGVLTEPATIRMATADPNGYSIPLYLAASGHEAFKRRNLTVEAITMPGSNAYPLMMTGKLDGNMGAPDVGLVNAIHKGANVRLVAPSQVQNPNSADGLYCGTSWLGTGPFDVTMLKGKTIGSSQKNYGISMVNLVKQLKKAGMQATDVELVQMSMTDQIPAVENGSLDCALLLEPVAKPIEAQGKMRMVQRQMVPDWPNGGFAFGSSILDDKREVGYAFVAAYHELVAKELKNPEAWEQDDLDRYSEILKKPAGYMNSTTTPIYKLPLAYPENYVEDLEETWRSWPDLLQFEGPLKKEQLIDGAFLDFANKLTY